MKRSNKKPPKVRQTTLSQFPLLPTTGLPNLRRSTRGTTTLVTPEDLPAPKLPAKPTERKGKPKQLKLKVEKKHSPAHNAPVLSPSLQQSPKSPSFAVVIITSPEKRRLLSQQTSGPIGLFPLLDQSQDQNIKPPLHGKKKGKEIAPQDASASDSEDIDPILASARKRKARTKARTIDKVTQDDGDKVSITSSKKNGKHTHVPPRNSDEDIDIASSSILKKRLWVSIPSQRGNSGPTPKRIRQKKSEKKSTLERVDDSGNGDGGDDDDDSNAPIALARKGVNIIKGEGKQLEGLLDIDVEDEEKEDLEEDLAFMGSKHSILSSRTRYNGSSPKKTPYQKKLDELRAKRAGKVIQPSTSDDDQPKRALYDTDPGENSSSEEEDDDDRGNRRTGGNYSSDNDSWIVEDDAGTLGAPDPDTQIPIEFTRLSHQSTRENFKIVCLWIVQSILNPLFPLDDELSVFALRALERRIDSYGGSVLQSSAWKAPFMRALKARPAFDSEPCDERQICDACHISGRTATYAVTITGGRYDTTTLEDLEGSDDDSEDSAGFEIPAAETVFYLGRNCHARAQMSHAFIHWKKQLRDAIETILNQQGYFNSYWASKSAKMDIQERTRWASQVTDNLGDHIKEFYHDLKRGLEDAQTNMTNQRSKKWR